MLTSGTAAPFALVEGFSIAFQVGIGIAGLGIIAALTLIRRDELAQPQQELEPMLEAA